MAEPITTPFEARLEAAFGAYAEAAPVAVDPGAMARAAAHSRPPRRWSDLRDTLRILRPALLLAALLMLLIAALVISGTWRLPTEMPLAPVATRLVVSDGLTVWLLGPEASPGSGRPVVAFGDWPGRSSCPTVIAGTTVMAGGGYGTWDLVGLAGGPVPEVTTSIDYAGFERWSQDRSKVMMGDFSGTLTVADFSDTATVRELSWPVPGLLGAAWSTDGTRIAAVRSAVVRASDGPSIFVELIDVAGGSSTLLGPYLVAPSAITEIGWTPDDRRLLLLQVGGEPEQPVTTLSIIDLADPAIRPLRDQVVDLPATIEDGYLSLSGPVAWSPDSRRLAIAPDDAPVITIVGPDAPVIIDLGGAGVTGPVTKIAWSADGRQLAAQVPEGLVVANADGTAAELRLRGATLAWAVDGDGVVAARVLDGELRVEHLAWDAAEPIPIAAWPAVGRSGEGPRACLEAQPLPR